MSDGQTRDENVRGVAVWIDNREHGTYVDARYFDAFCQPDHGPTHVAHALTPEAVKARREAAIDVIQRNNFWPGELVDAIAKAWGLAGEDA